jgi:hypothetical protein
METKLRQNKQKIGDDMKHAKGNFGVKKVEAPSSAVFKQIF